MSWVPPTMPCLPTLLGCGMKSLPREFMESRVKQQQPGRRAEETFLKTVAVSLVHLTSPVLNEKTVQGWEVSLCLFTKSLEVGGGAGALHGCPRANPSWLASSKAETIRCSHSVFPSTSSLV